jgi:uncharacterized protein YecE (DUF72 family)
VAATKVGISAWTEPTLIASGWYPPGARTAEARLRHYATQFPLVEIDSPYYAIPAERQAHAWVERTPAHFTMNVKANALLTGHYTDAHRLPRDLQTELPEALRHKERLYPRELPADFLDEVTRRFCAALAPLRESGKLGVLLLQYPVWFPFSRSTADQLVATRARLAGWPLAVEFRNSTWMSDRHRAETLRLLRDHGLAYTCVDEPQGFPSSVPPIVAATADLALVRMHGRNALTWDRDLPSAAARMDYRYTVRELHAWVSPVRALAAQTREVHVVMNNCHRDNAVTNAAQLTELLARTRPARPRPAAAANAP